ncbi:MAG: hypothetical protein MUF22_01495 [Chitinispirillaceae bacterium]|nr:hypothetical protein [Chitinispirillaceae bacterium]
MKLRLSLLSVIIVSLQFAIIAQPVFEVENVDGTVKVQRMQKQKWAKVSPGQKLSDNDIVETFFQSRLVMRLGNDITVIFGSNSKALLSLSSTGGPKKDQAEANFSLFSGGILLKTQGKTRLSVYTTNAVAEISRGSMVVIVDAKSGETGVQVLGDTAMVRNISKQEGKPLPLGYTTIILPNRDPTPPLFLSVRHVAVLKHFFGDQYISGELKSAAITPTDNLGSANKILVSQNGKTDKKKSDNFTYKRIFNLGKIYNSILTDRAENDPPYKPAVRPCAASGRPGSVSVTSDLGVSDQGLTTGFTFMPHVSYRFIDAGLRFRTASNHVSERLTGYGSTDAWLDMMEHLTIGSVRDSVCLTAGTLRDVTMGNGLIVSRFRNSDNNRIYNPFGVSVVAPIANVAVVKAFMADVTTGSTGGVHLTGDISPFFLGAGFYFDSDPYAVWQDTGALRYTRLLQSDPTFPAASLRQKQLSVYELSFQAIVTESPDFSMTLVCEFAQKLESGRNDGYIISLPKVFLAWPAISSSIGLKLENGRIISGQFDEFYYSRRSFTAAASADTVLTANTVLSRTRKVFGGVFSFQANPVRGLDVGAGLQHDFFAKNVFTMWNDSLDGIRVSSPEDFSLDIHVSTDSALIRALKYSTLYLRQHHGRLYPRTGTYFSSWNMEAGFELITRPLLFNTVSFTAGGRMFYLDHGPHPDNVITTGDRIMELSAGITGGFL